MTKAADFVNRHSARNGPLTPLGEPPFNQEDDAMATDPLANVRNEIGLRVAEIRDAGPRLSPLDLHARMDAIRQLAVLQRPRHARRTGALLGAARAASRPPRRRAVVPRACRRGARQPDAERHARPFSPRSPYASTRHRDAGSRIEGAMRAFSQLLDDLVYTRSRNTKLRLIGDYLKQTPDPDRGFGLAALTGTLDIPAVKPARPFGQSPRSAIDPVLLIHEPRLCRRHGRDRRAAMAEADR